MDNLLNKITTKAEQITTRVGDALYNTADKAVEIAHQHKRRALIENLMIKHLSLDAEAAAARADEILAALAQK